MNHHDHTPPNHKIMERFFSNSAYQMIDISSKIPTQRTAIASGEIHVGKEAFELIANRTLPKGDALVLAEIAGINGAKTAYQMIPLCHPIGLELVKIHIVLNAEHTSIKVYCIAATYSKTGVEMEALAGVNSALLAIYDLTKMIQPALELNAIRLLYKTGGKSGVWIHPDAQDEPLVKELQADQPGQLLDNLNCAVICLSDRASNGVYQDGSGVKLKALLVKDGAAKVDYQILPDDIDQLKQKISSYLEMNSAPQIIMLTGGTGVAERDITPEAIEGFCTKLIPGIGELLRMDGAKYTPYSWLSRSMAGIVENRCLMIALPGSTNAVLQGYQAIRQLLPHILEQIIME